MDSVLVQLLVIIAIGVVGIAIARFSRGSFEKKYGKASRKEKLRFTLMFFCMLSVLLWMVIFYPVSAFLVIAALILCAFLGLLGTKPGIYKEVMYSATACSIIAGFVALFVHGL